MTRQTTINNIPVSVTGEISDEEIAIYLKQLHEKNHHNIISADVKVDGEYVDVSYTFKNVPFDRIRRITGYLVGTTRRFNDAKKAEVRDRVKHGGGIVNANRSN